MSENAMELVGQSNIAWIGQPTPIGSPRNDCRVYWGSHGCDLERGHKGLHSCDCCDCPNHRRHFGSRVDEEGYEYWCVATWPYYGGITSFYGEDAPILSLRERRRLERDWTRATRRGTSLIHNGRKPR